MSFIIKLTDHDIRLGKKLKTYDFEEKKWFLAEIIKVDDDGFKTVDIDKNSDWEGLEIDWKRSEIADREQIMPI